MIYRKFQASYVPEVHVLNSCCETFVLEIEKRKKQINRNSHVIEKTVVVFNESLSEAHPKGLKEKPKI